MPMPSTPNLFCFRALSPKPEPKPIPLKPHTLNPKPIPLKPQTLNPKPYSLLAGFRVS